eukprot:Opistho-1_new@41204
MSTYPVSLKESRAVDALKSYFEVYENDGESDGSDEKVSEKPESPSAGLGVSNTDGNSGGDGAARKSGSVGFGAAAQGGFGFGVGAEGGFGFRPGAPKGFRFLDLSYEEESDGDDADESASAGFGVSDTDSDCSDDVEMQTAFDDPDPYGEERDGDYNDSRDAEWGGDGYDNDASDVDNGAWSEDSDKVFRGDFRDLRESVAVDYFFGPEDD